VALIADARADKAQRLQFIQVLGEVHPAAAIGPLLELLEKERDDAVRQAVLNSLLGYEDPRIGRTVARIYAELSGPLRTSALTLLTSRASWSLQLAEVVDKGQVPAGEIPRDSVRRMQLHKNAALAALLTKHWPPQQHPTTQAMQTQIQHLSGVIRAGKGDPYQGQKLFNNTCGSCHRLFARGGQVGPDLTTYQRSEVDTLLLHIVNPSAEIREGYENVVLETRDERTLNGFLVERDPQLVVLRGLDGQNISVPRQEITEMRPAGMSLMPEGLIDQMNEQQLRDLFAYLRSTQPLAN
jgi:putative heme-binding domain-containing protein